MTPIWANFGHPSDPESAETGIRPFQLLAGCIIRGATVASPAHFHGLPVGFVKQRSSAQSDESEDYHCEPNVPVKQTSSARLKSAMVHEQERK